MLWRLNYSVKLHREFNREISTIFSFFSATFIMSFRINMLFFQDLPCFVFFQFFFSFFLSFGRALREATHEYARPRPPGGYRVKSYCAGWKTLTPLKGNDRTT